MLTHFPVTEIVNSAITTDHQIAAVLTNNRFNIMKKNEQKNAINLKTGINKLLLIMKLTFFMVMVNIFAASAAGYSQTAKVNLDLRDATLKEVLTEIEAQTNLSFIYKSDLVDPEQKVDIQASDASIEQVLAYLFSERNIRCDNLDKTL